MRFTYVLSGWEGSAADGRVFADARTKDFAISPGTYYLADAGYPACDALLVPYRGVRYHLKEWGRAPQRYRSLTFYIQALIQYFLDLGITESSLICATHKHAMLLSGYLEW